MIAANSMPVVRFQHYRVPDEHVALVQSALGAIDLDPVDPKFSGQPEADTGWLNESWYGRVWMCPPFNRQLMPRYVDKLLSEFAAGGVTQAIVLTNNSTDTKWWHRLAQRSACICFTRGRIMFGRPEGDAYSPTQGQTFFYFGADSRRFRETFTGVGFFRPRMAVSA